MKKFAFSLFIILLLVGCGGGGGSGGGGGDGNPVSPLSSGSGATVSGRLAGEGSLENIAIFLVQKSVSSPSALKTKILSGTTATQIYSSTTNPDGHFTFSGVEKGMYNLIAQKSRTQSAILKDISVDGSAVLSDFVLTLKPTGDIRGEVSVPAGVSKLGIAAFIKGTSFFAYTDESGLYTISGVPVGAYDLAFSRAGLKTYENLNVQVNAALQTTIPLVSMLQENGLLWQGSFTTAPASPQTNFAYYNSSDKKAYIWDGDSWEILVESGTSQAQLIWKGTFTAPPASPEINWAYYNSTDKKSYFWDGTAWQNLTSDGASGAAGTAGATGLGIIWKGVLAAHPAAPQNGWAYYNTADNKAYLFDGSLWQILAQAPAGDVTPPTIASFQVFQLSTSTVNVSWKTNEETLSQTQYGPTSAYGSLLAETAIFAKDYFASFTPTFLGIHHFQGRSRDASGNLMTTGDTATPILGPAWKRNIGGGNTDEARSIIPTADGGAFVVGIYFVDGVTLQDIRIEKIAANGTTQWSQTYGGSGFDFANKAQKTSDGGLIVVGSTDTGDMDPGGYHSGNDILVFKIDSAGTLVWAKIFGGTDTQEAFSVKQTADGGYIIVGNTLGGDGDILTAVRPFHGGSGSDVWVIKIDQFGAMEWNTCLGGALIDNGKDVQITPGGYLIGAQTESGLSDGDLSFGTHGVLDVWFSEISSDGSTVIREKTFGGSGNEYYGRAALTPDGGLIFGASTESDDYDVSGNQNPGSFDFWVVKLDSAWNIQWKKCYGGSSNEWLISIIPLSGGGYLLGGSSSSNDGDVGYNITGNGKDDFWLIRINNTGGILERIVMGGSDAEWITDLAEAIDLNYLVAGASLSTDGDIDSNAGSADWWFMKVKAQ